MTSQEIFDKSAAGLLKQGHKSQDEFEKCKYRGLEGRKCAAGFLIEDFQYKPQMDTQPLNTIREIIKDFGLWDLSEHENLLESLQMIHDFYIPGLWKFQLKNLALRYRLSSSAIENL